MRLKIICLYSALSLFCGDCVWGMEDDKIHENLLKQSQQSSVQKYGK